MTNLQLGLRTLTLSVMTAAAMILLPSTSSSAYSGLQVLRDESGCCVEVISNIYDPVQGSSSWNGYDWDSLYSHPAVGNYLDYYSYPNPSPTYECPVAHIPNISQANNFLTFTGYHPSQGTAEANQVNERYARNYWINIPSNFWYTNDYMQTSDTPDKSGSGDWAVDVISFHYNQDHVTCSY